MPNLSNVNKNLLVLSVMSMVMVISCTGNKMIYNEMDMTGVDSAFVFSEDRILVLSIYSASGIGTLRADLTEPVFAETVQFRFYYEKGRPYASCENLQAVIHVAHPEEQVQLQSGSYGLVNGTIGVSAGIEVEAVNTSWIDYYRD